MKLRKWLGLVVIYGILCGMLFLWVTETTALIGGLVSLLSIIPSSLLTYLLEEEKKVSESAAKDIVSHISSSMNGDTANAAAVRKALLTNSEWSTQTRRLVERYLNTRTHFT